MSMSNNKVVEKFAKGATKGRSHNIFIENDILYDYGHHFPLLVRMPWGLLQNADKYSITTSQHQSITSQYADVLIPFSVLESARIIRYRYPLESEIELIDKTKERWDITGYKQLDEKEWQKSKIRKYIYISISKYESLSKNEKENWSEVTERRPSGVVIKHKDKYYLSSMDGWNYFLSLLPHPINTVKEAFESLLPKEVTGKEGVDYLRQGEWFFIPSLLDMKKYKRDEKSQFELLPRNGGTGHHIATRARVVLGIPYVKGTVRHTGRDHKMLKLGDLKSWYMAVESNHIQSWGANGRVD